MEGFCEPGEKQCDCQLLKKDIFAPRGLLFFLCVGFDFYEQTDLYREFFFLKAEVSAAHWLMRSS